MFITLLVSAFWHGVAPGYYLTFLMVPFVVIAEVRMEKAIKPYLSPKLCYCYDWLGWFFHYRSMEYLGCGFMLLQLEPCLAAWKSMYFVGHVVIFAFIVISMLIPKKHSDDKETQKKLSWASTVLIQYVHEQTNHNYNKSAEDNNNYCVHSMVFAAAYSLVACPFLSFHAFPKDPGTKVDQFTSTVFVLFLFLFCLSCLW